MYINHQEYWDDRFKSGDWTKNKGSLQTLFHYNVLLNHMPEWLKKEISNEKMSICDLGSGMGEGVNLFKKNFRDSKVTGVDFSDYAISEAKKKYSNASFICSDISKFEKHFDVIISSHTLEHFEDPHELFNNILKLADKYFILIIPFQEEELFKEHFYSFDYNFFPINMQHHELVHFKEIDKIFYEPLNYWDKEQILIIYANKNNIDLEKFSLEQLHNNYFNELKLAKENYETRLLCEKKKIEELKNLNEQYLSQYLSKFEDLTKNKQILESNLLNQKKKIGELGKRNEYLTKNNQNLKELVETYKARKVVRTADTIQKIYHYPKSRLKNISKPKEPPAKPELDKTKSKKSRKA